MREEEHKETNEAEGVEERLAELEATPEAPPKRSWTRRILVWAIWGILLGIPAGFGTGYYILWQGARFEDLQHLQAYKPKLYTRIYDRNGVFITPISSEKRIVLDYEDIPKDFVNAMVALEDEDFFDHIGVSPLGILSAVKDNLLRGTLRGASTLTQQLVKNITKDTEVSYYRKIKEQFLAVQLEARLTKQEIFAMYANEVPFGNNQFGIESAAKYYFGKSVGELSLVECATLAGLPQAPSYFNPYRHLERCRRKRNIVLSRMEEESYITREEFEKAIKEPLELRRKTETPRPVAAHFIDKVREYLFETYGEEAVRTSAWDVYTTIDLRYQRIAEDAVRDALKEKDKTLGYRHYDCPSVFSGKDITSDVLETYFDPSWHKNLQEGINVRAVVMGVGKDFLLVRIRDQMIRLELDSVAWIGGNIKDLNKHFKVGDVPWFTLHPLPEQPEEEIPEEIEVPEAALAEGPQLEPEELGVDEPPEEMVVETEQEESFPFHLVLDQEPDIEGAFTAIDPTTGDILAMVGGYDYRTSKFNRAEQAKRQVGSAIKPVIFGAALERGYTLSDVVVDEPTLFWDPTQFQLAENGELELYNPNGNRARRIRLGLLPRPEPYIPDNYYKTFDGKITLRRALAQSTNIVAVKLLNAVGYDHVLEYADRLHLMDNTELQPFPSMALGAPEITLTDMVFAYGTFSQEGVRYKPRFIRSIMNDKGLYIEKNEKEGEQVISPRNAFLVTNAMKEVIHGRKATARNARQLGLEHIAGKTGTTNDYTNAWFVGFSRQIAAGAWVGRDLNHTIGRGATGGNSAAPIWIRFMQGIKDDLEDKPFPTPEGITTIPVDYYSGKKITRDCDCPEKDMILEVFERGTEPTEICSQEDREDFFLPWYLQKRAYQVDEAGNIKPALVEINYPSQRRAIKYLEEREARHKLLQSTTPNPDSN